MRTYDRATFVASKEAWRDFGWQWQELRRIAADRGFIFPPAGTKHDDRDADQPSQRAIIWRALVDNPEQTRAIVSRSSSWSQVVDRIIGMEERIRRDADELARDDGWDRRDDINHREAVTALGSILQRIDDSRSGAA